MPDIDVDGVRIHYEVTEGDRTRLPLLLSHGFSASGAMWAPNLAALSAQRRVVTWDMRGHGRSDSPRDPASYSADLTVRDMGAILDAVGADRAVLGGLSLGGYMSLRFLLARPERVAALVLCDTGPGFRREEPRANWNRGAHAIADAWERGLVAPSPDRPEVVPPAEQNLEGIAHAARGMLVQHDGLVVDLLARIDVPTLVIVGSDDTNFLAAAHYMASRIPGAQLETIPNAGHAANIDQPEAFDARVVRFLDALP